MLSFISHDVTQAFFQPLTTTDFLDDVVVFGEPSSRGIGNGNTDANARNRRQGQGKSGGGGGCNSSRNRSGGGSGVKVDIYLLKTRNATKVLAAVRLCRASLVETMKKVEVLTADNKELCERLSGFSV